MSIYKHDIMELDVKYKTILQDNLELKNLINEMESERKLLVQVLI
jgi:hypothetical protein